MDRTAQLARQYVATRAYSLQITAPLKPEDYVVQPVVDVSPPKWHLGHTTWFFETFLLREFLPGYAVFHEEFGYVFNSYYESIGKRVMRTDRGNLSRPSVDEVLAYRAHVDAGMAQLLDLLSTQGIPRAADCLELLQLGLQHEQQHQELLLTDIKYILGHNPLLPPYDSSDKREKTAAPAENHPLAVAAGLHTIGFEGEGFCFDNELSAHQVFLHAFEIDSRPITNGEYLDFIAAGGYRDFRYWLSEGWEWVKTSGITAPMYWHPVDGNWQVYTLAGLQPLDPAQPVSHVNYYEAEAFARWKGKRLPTEQEWETAARQFPELLHSPVWEWTASAYLPYPGFTQAEGAVGEYNGKFMVSQMVLRGGSLATPPGHIRTTYRNFFPPYLQWQFSGIRLCARQVIPPFVYPNNEINT